MMGVLIAVDEAAAGVSECLTDWNLEKPGIPEKVAEEEWSGGGGNEVRCVQTSLFSLVLIDG